MERRPNRRRRCVVALLLIAVLAPAGCGGGEQLQPIDRSRLSAQLTEVRDAAGRGDRSAARQALDDFVGEVRRLQRAGALDGATAGALLLGAQRARDRLEVELAPPPPAQPVTPAPQPQPEPTKPKERKKPKPEAKAAKEEKKQEKKDDGGSAQDGGHKGGKKH